MRSILHTSVDRGFEGRRVDNEPAYFRHDLLQQNGWIDNSDVFGPNTEWGMHLGRIYGQDLGHWQPTSVRKGRSCNGSRRDHHNNIAEKKGKYRVR